MIRIIFRADSAADRKYFYDNAGMGSIRSKARERLLVITDQESPDWIL